MLQAIAPRRASITVEFAIVSSLVLLPLFGGGADFVQIIAAKAQLNAALQSFDAYAWNNPAAATNTGQLASILALLNQHSLAQITFPDGKADATTNYTPQLTYYCSTPPAATQTQQSTQCAAGQTQDTVVTYNLAAKIPLVVPLPFSPSNIFSLSDSGQVEVQ